jgi:hypothetical protein
LRLLLLPGLHRDRLDRDDSEARPWLRPAWLEEQRTEYEHDGQRDPAHDRNETDASPARGDCRRNHRRNEPGDTARGECQEKHHRQHP